MIEIITKTFTKLSTILQTVQGWAVAAGIFVAEYFFADHATSGTGLTGSALLQVLRHTKERLLEKNIEN